MVLRRFITGEKEREGGRGDKVLHGVYRDELGA